MLHLFQAKESTTNNKHSGVLGSSALATPGSLLEMQILGPHRDLLEQKLWEPGPAIVL